jgi:hypothetical protein
MEMTGPAFERRAYTPTRYRRGTRGFAAFVTLINGLAVLGLGIIVLPASVLPTLAMTWAVPLAITAGILHLVAVVGLVQGRLWSRSLVIYLAAAGIGVAAYGLLAAATRLDLVGTVSVTTAVPSTSDGLGVLVWMIGAWLVAAGFAYKAFTSHRPGRTTTPKAPSVVQPAPTPTVAPAPRLVFGATAA